MFRIHFILIILSEFSFVGMVIRNKSIFSRVFLDVNCVMLFAMKTLFN